jgi:hypothetical protein
LRGLGNVDQIEELLNRLIGKSLLLLKEDCVFILFRINIRNFSKDEVY